MCSKRSSKKLWMILFGVVLCFVASLVIFNNNSFATTSDEVVETNLFGNFVDDGTQHYKASFGHDDIVMSAIQSEFVRATLQYKILLISL